MVLKKGVSLINTNRPFLELSFYLFVVFVFCSFTRFLSLFLYSDIWLLQVSNFWKAKTKINFCICKLLTQCNTGSVTGGVSIYLYGCVSFLLVYVYLCVWCQIRVLAKCHLCQTFSKFNPLLHKIYSKVLLVLRYQDRNLGL